MIEPGPSFNSGLCRSLIMVVIEHGLTIAQFRDMATAAGLIPPEPPGVSASSFPPHLVSGLQDELQTVVGAAGTVSGRGGPGAFSHPAPEIKNTFWRLFLSFFGR
ncbi:MAG: hypothetical protein RLZZ501_1570 [Pseudomonadota bacterium]|jgi:hypothetical protein